MMCTQPYTYSMCCLLSNLALQMALREQSTLRALRGKD